MSSDLEVDPEALRRCAAELAGTSARVASGVAPPPPSGPPPSGWATVEALGELQVVAARRFGRLGAASSAASRRLGEAADGYEAADDRAAGRLRPAFPAMVHATESRSAGPA
jgi:hypothetical protein